MDESRGQVVQCPECRAFVGPGAGVDVYKHGLNCLHYPNEGKERVLASVAGKEDEHSRRIRAFLSAGQVERVPSTAASELPGRGAAGADQVEEA